MNILIIGASSYVGARLFEEIKKVHPQTFGTYNTHKLFEEFIHLDLLDEESIHKAFQKTNPDIVLIVSALSNQAAVSRDPNKAYEINVEGPRKVVDFAKIFNSKLIYLSTEAVFHNSDYGNLKLKAEEIVNNSQLSHLILRLGMCFGRSPNTINDRPHNRLLRAIEKQEEVIFDSSLKFYPTELGHLSRVILSLMEKNYWNDCIDVICMPETDRFEIANYVLEQHKITVKENVSENLLMLPPMSQGKLVELGIEITRKEQFLDIIKKDLKVF